LVSSKRLGVNPPGYDGGHGGDEICHANGFLGVQMALIVGVFSGPCLLNNLLYFRRTQAPVPLGSFNCFFLFL
jgi:hypothetical protein